MDDLTGAPVPSTGTAPAPLAPPGAGAPGSPATCYCDICPLRRDRAGGPVFGEGPEDAGLVVVGEAPGYYEVQDGRPFVGPSGRYLDTMLGRRALLRAEVRVTNVLLCRPPEQLTLEDYLKEVQRENGRIAQENLGRRAEGRPLKPRWPMPMDCCRLRLLAELQRARTIIPLGGVALAAVCGAKGIQKWRGSVCRVAIPRGGVQPPAKVREDMAGADRLRLIPPPALPLDDPQAGTVWMVPTLHPAFVLRDGPGRTYNGVVQADFAKALRIHLDRKVDWEERRTVLFPTAEQVEQLLDQARGCGRPVAVDVETTGGHVLTTELLCCGFAWNPTGGHNDETALVVPLRRPQNLEPFYDWADEQRVRAAMAALLADPAVTTVYHNHIYDVTVLERHGFAVAGRIHDTMLLHHSTWAEFPHRLAFVASLRLDVRYWKDDVRDKGGRFDPARVTDEVSFYRYNARDVYVTARLLPILQHEAATAGQTTVYEQELVLARIARGMQRVGLPVDLTKAAGIKDRLVAREEVCRAEMEVVLADTDYRERIRARAEQIAARPSRELLLADGEHFRPAGTRALRCAVEALQLPITQRTPTGLIATDKDELARCLPYASQTGRRFIRLLTAARRDGAVEELGWRPCQKLRSTYIQAPPVLGDGRLHPDWKVHGTVTGRSATSPNVQNIPKWIRGIFVARPGYLFVGADYQALEWRIAAALSQDAALLAMFEAEDPHRVNAAMIFGCSPEAVTGEQRNLAKRALYGMAYLASAQTIYENLLPEWPELTLGAVEAVVRRIERHYAVWHRWRQEYIEGVLVRGYAESAICGRKRRFLAHQDVATFNIVSGHTEIANYPAQATAADVLNVALVRLDAAHEAARWARNAWLLATIHDAVLYEAPFGVARRWAGAVAEVMPGPYDLAGVRDPVRFPVDVRIGRTWAAV